MSLDGWVGIGLPDKVMEEAVQWIARLDGDRFSDATHAEFSGWLDATPEHRWAFEELSESWARMNTLQDVHHLIEHPQVLNFPATARQQHVPPVIGWHSIAATVLMVLGLGVATLVDNPGHHSPVSGTSHELRLAELSSPETNFGFPTESTLSGTVKDLWLD